MHTSAGNAHSAPTGTEHPNADPAVLLLCRGVRAGDRAAFTTLYNGWYGRWLGETRAMLGRDHALQYDIVHEAFLRVIRKLPALNNEPSLAAWMTRTLRSSAIDMLRAEHRRIARARVPKPGAANEENADVDHAWLLRCVASLEQQDQELLRARVVGGATLDQAGRAVGLTGDAAHGRIRRALARLREAMGGTHE